MIDFSLVCPIKNEANLIPKTVPSFYKVGPSEVVFCFDNPPHKESLSLVKNTASLFPSIKTKIILVNRNPNYAFHQAWVRRKGFLEATYDRILTTDVDLVLNRNVLKAIELVGKNNIGLASCQKFAYPNSLTSFCRLVGETFLKKMVYPLWHRHRGRGLQMTTFTGLYAFWRPYWLDTEDEAIKQLVNPKTSLRKGGEKYPSHYRVCLGEDTYLRNCMEKKHLCAYLPDIGGFCLTDLLAHHSHVQFERGRYYANQGRNIFGAIVTTTMHIQPHYLKGYLYEKTRK